VKPQHWVPVAVFLGVSIPLVLLLNVMNVGGDYRIWIAMGAGALATAFAQNKLSSKSGSATLLEPPRGAGRASPAQGAVNQRGEEQ